MEKIRINQGRIVPFHFRFGVSIVFFMIIGTSLMYLPEWAAITVCILVSFLFPPLWSSYHLLEIDPKGKFFNEILWLSGWKKEAKKPFDAIEKIYINAARMGQQQNSLSGQVNTRRFKEYKAFLKFTDGSNLFLLSGLSEEGLMKKLTPLSEKLGCPIVKNFE